MEITEKQWFNNNTGEWIDIDETQEQIFTRWAKHMGIEDSPDGDPAWEKLRHRYKRFKNKGKK